MPSKFAFCTLKPDTETPTRPPLFRPSTLMPFASPVASIMVLYRLEPSSEIVFPITTSSLYMPGDTLTTSPAEAAATAAPIVRYGHSGLGYLLTHRVAPA